MDDDASSRGARGVRRRVPGRAAARSLGWVLIINLAVAGVLIASTAAGQLLPTATETTRLEGQWYQVHRCPFDAETVVVEPVESPRGESSVYVGRDEISHTGFFAPVRLTRRVWVADPRGELKTSAVRAAVRGSLRSSAATAEWAGVLDAKGGAVTRPVWWGATVYGAAFVVPVLLSLAAAGFYAQRAGEALGRWRLARANRCTGCGYSLHELEYEDAPRCPECGEARGSGVQPGRHHPHLRPC